MQDEVFALNLLQ